MHKRSLKNKVRNYLKKAANADDIRKNGGYRFRKMAFCINARQGVKRIKPRRPGKRHTGNEKNEMQPLLDKG